MSGIEIAGLVLGAIPLVIAALEHYQDIIDPAKALIKFHGELGHATRQLRNQHTLFEQSIEVLLRPITTDQELSDMIDNTNSKLWQDPAIEHELRRSLGKAYPAYMRTVNDIQKVMLDIAIKLDNVRGVENLSRDGLEAIISQHAAAKVDGKLQRFDISKKVKFTMRRKKIKHSLEELQRCIEMLDKFQVKADKIAAANDLEKSYGRFRSTLHVNAIRENAGKLHNVLLDTWCSSHSSHSAGLLLEQRLIDPRRRGPEWHRNPIMNRGGTSHFSLSLLQSPTSIAKKWLDVEIQLEESSTTMPQRSSPIQVKISAPTSSSLTTAITPLPHHNPSQLQIVTNLCSILQNPSHHCIGFCLDSDGRLRGAYNATRTAENMNEGVSLKEILMKEPRAFTPQERYNLSITLTSSLLQLSHTPWLQETWDKTDIVFFRAKDGCPMSDIEVDVKHPYLTREHQRTSTHVSQGSMEPNDSSKVAALGVMLLEICYGLPIENLLQPEDLGPNNRPTEISYLQAARRWLIGKEGKGEFSFAFLKAISYCLQCFMNPSASLLDQAFFKTMEVNVLVPLVEEMNILLFGLRDR